MKNVEKPLRVRRYSGSGSTQHVCSLLRLDGGAGFCVLGIDPTSFDDYIEQTQNDDGWEVMQEFYVNVADVVRDGWEIER